MHRLDEVVDTLLVLQKKHRIRFDVWQVVKRDHAIISFFDQGMNPAVRGCLLDPLSLPAATESGKPVR